ncbi:MAG: transcription-repair coupling factor [Proteobacteria bacterium HN_bin10]|nr:MAG: transcription-repair coupling factor [Proteobacteria bacterium HN_bin10]
MKDPALPQKLIETLARSKDALTVSGAPEGVDAAGLAEAARLRGGVTVFVARDETRAAQFEAAVKFFTPELETLRLPGWDTLPYDRISPAASVAAQRCAALTQLARRSEKDAPLLVVATASAVAQRTPPRQRLTQGAFAAEAGAETSMEQLETYLVVNGYARASTVRAPGEFAVRGGLIDVFPPGAAEPFRFDFFGDTLETIRSFDPETQISKAKFKSALLTPVSEVLLDELTVLQFRRRFTQAFGAVSDPLYDSVSARIRRQGVEQFLPFFYERLETVFDYAGAGALVAFDALAEEAIKERVETARDHYQSRKTAPIPRGGAPFRAPEPDLLYLGEEALNAALASHAVRRFTHFDTDAKKQLDLGARPGRDFAPERQTADINVFEAAANHIEALSKAKKRILIAAWSDGSAERLAGVLADHGVDAVVRSDSWRHASALPKDAHALVVLPIEHGFETEQLALIAEQDILGDRLARPRKRRKASSVIAEAAAMSQGDLIVHQDHGVGRYEGLKTLDVAGAPHDCLDLTYAGGDKLYLPVENIELVSRYGAEDAEAQLDRLGGVAWQSRKARAKQRLRDMAEELLRIAALRATRVAEPVAPPEGLWDEFCARFPYEETDDQLAAIDDVIGDLAAGRPMDRLICGDVGFGKTEVALRAAFLVAMTGKQVAVVAPTTLLCRQHFRTFSERFRGLPIRVRQLSRLVSAKEANETKAGLTDGTIEIVIGTHALLSKTIKFSDLGLMIIDEEQHFGVKHKERLKDLRAEVHALTLSATPIPRTLQLALAGVREMSLITTPPIDRMAVRTYVTPFDAVTVREALLREKYRGGQSFFVAPRISDLEEVSDFLRRNVPEVSFAVAHGQMAAGALDEIMTNFYDGAFDVLVSTSIVESGLDIPRANTLVLFRADMFGLAQLYQLRGRVGRSKLRAYAYLTTAAEQTLTVSAEKRLKILSSLDNLGAGFTLASHDLDMRGGGNLLGEEQSGHIREVGVELYQSMLEEAVASLRDGTDEAVSEKSWSPQINVGASVLIPEEYVADLTVRLALYRRLAELDTDQEREAFAAELIDRFGPLPPEADQLIAVAALKALCRRCQISKLDAGPKGAVLTFRESGFPDPLALVRFITERPDDYKMRPDGKLVVQGGWPEAAQRLKALRTVLEAMARLAIRKAA